MARVSAEQVLHALKKNGAYDAMRQELQTTFTNSERGGDFEAKIREIMKSVSEERVYLRSADKRQLLERRIAEQLGQTGLLERMDTEARNFWLVAERQKALKQRLTQAIGEAAQSAEQVEDAVSRPLEIDPPRIPPQGSSYPPRTHSFYRRGDTVAAFVALSDPLCNESQYMCILAEIIACDSERNAYTISDMDAHEGIQGTWVAHWDQLIAIKRPYEYVYKVGEQVYALYRDDSSTHTQVTTEFFPGRVEHVGPVSLAIRFDTGELGHVYYDEAFAAGRIGFLRRFSEERRRNDGSDAMVEFQGKTIPSFTGFWPDVARPALGKHGRKVRYRQMPPLLVACEPPTQAGSVEPLSPSSDMDIAGSSSGAPSPMPQKLPSLCGDQARPSEPQLEMPPPPPPPPTQPLPPLPPDPEVSECLESSKPEPRPEPESRPEAKPRQGPESKPRPKSGSRPGLAASSDEEGEIDNAEDGEVEIPASLRPGPQAREQARARPHSGSHHEASGLATLRYRDALAASNALYTQRPSVRSRSRSRSHSPSRRYSRGSTRWEREESPRRRDRRRSHGPRYSDRPDSYTPRDSYRRRSPSRARHLGHYSASRGGRRSRSRSRSWSRSRSRPRARGSFSELQHHGYGYGHGPVPPPHHPLQHPMGISGANPRPSGVYMQQQQSYTSQEPFNRHHPSQNQR